MFNKSKSLSQQVKAVVKSHVEVNGATWLLTLGYGPSNDYAQYVADLLKCRFETAARYIRIEKNRVRNEQAAPQPTTV